MSRWMVFRNTFHPFFLHQQHLYRLYPSLLLVPNRHQLYLVALGHLFPRHSSQVQVAMHPSLVIFLQHRRAVLLVVQLHVMYTSQVQGMISQFHSRGNPSHSMVSLVSITLIHSILSQLHSILSMFHKVPKLRVCFLLAQLEGCLRHPDHTIQVQWGEDSRPGLHSLQICQVRPTQSHLTRHHDQLLHHSTYLAQGDSTKTFLVLLAVATASTFPVLMLGRFMGLITSMYLHLVLHSPTKHCQVSHQWVQGSHQ